MRDTVKQPETGSLYYMDEDCLYRNKEGFYFIVSGIDMVFIGSDISRAVAASRSMTDREI